MGTRPRQAKVVSRADKPRAANGVVAPAVSRLAPRGPGKRMMLLDEGFEPFLEHVRVDLSRADVGVAEETLDSAQIGAAGKQVRREGMAQHVGRDLRVVETGVCRELIHEMTETMPRQMAAGA